MTASFQIPWHEDAAIREQGAKEMTQKGNWVRGLADTIMTMRDAYERAQLAREANYRPPASTLPAIKGGQVVGLGQQGTSDLLRMVQQDNQNSVQNHLLVREQAKRGIENELDRAQQIKYLDQQFKNQVKLQKMRERYKSDIAEARARAPRVVGTPGSGGGYIQDGTYQELWPTPPKEPEVFGGQATGYFTLDDNGQVVSLKEPVARGNRGGGAGGLAAAQTVPKSRITLSQIATMADSSKTDTPLQVADLPPLIAQISDPGERAMAEAWYSQKVRGHREAEVAAQVAAWDSYYEKEAEYEVAMARAQKVNGGWWKGNDVEWPEKPKPPEFPDPRKQPAAPQVAPEELLGYGMGPIRTAPTVTIAPDGLEVILED